MWLQWMVQSTSQACWQLQRRKISPEALQKPFFSPTHSQSKVIPWLDIKLFFSLPERRTLRMKWSLAEARQQYIFAFTFRLLASLKQSVLCFHFCLFLSRLSYHIFVFQKNRVFFYHYHYLFFSIDTRAFVSSTRVFVLSLLFVLSSFTLFALLSSVEQRSWAAVICFQHDSRSINNKTEGRGKKKKKSIPCCDSLVLQKSVWIQIGSRYKFIISISVLSIGFFLEDGFIKTWWNYFLFCPYLLQCSPRGIVLAHLACLRNSAPPPAGWCWDILERSSVAENSAQPSVGPAKARLHGPAWRFCSRSPHLHERKGQYCSTPKEKMSWDVRTHPMNNGIGQYLHSSLFRLCVYCVLGPKWLNYKKKMGYQVTAKLFFKISLRAQNFPIMNLLSGRFMF